MLLDGEEIFAAFKTVRDQVIVTDKRVIAVNVQGVTGKKKNFTRSPTARSRRSRSRPPRCSTSTPR